VVVTMVYVSLSWVLQSLLNLSQSLGRGQISGLILTPLRFVHDACLALHLKVLAESHEPLQDRFVPCEWAEDYVLIGRLET
jgi:hypothetical protein